MYEIKKEFRERIEKQIGKKDAEKFFATFKQRTRKALRVNTLKSNFSDGTSLFAMASFSSLLTS